MINVLLRFVKPLLKQGYPGCKELVEELNEANEDFAKAFFRPHQLEGETVFFVNPDAAPPAGSSQEEEEEEDSSCSEEEEY